MTVTLGGPCIKPQTRNLKPRSGRCLRSVSDSELVRSRPGQVSFLPWPKLESRATGMRNARRRCGVRNGSVLKAASESVGLAGSMSLIQPGHWPCASVARLPARHGDPLPTERTCRSSSTGTRRFTSWLTIPRC